MQMGMKSTFKGFSAHRVDARIRYQHQNIYSRKKNRTSRIPGRQSANSSCLNSSDGDRVAIGQELSRTSEGLSARLDSLEVEGGGDTLIVDEPG